MSETTPSKEWGWSDSESIRNNPLTTKINENKETGMPTPPLWLQYGHCCNHKGGAFTSELKALVLKNKIDEARDLLREKIIHLNKAFPTKTPMLEIFRIEPGFDLLLSWAIVADEPEAARIILQSGCIDIKTSFEKAFMICKASDQKDMIQVFIDTGYVKL